MCDENEVRFIHPYTPDNPPPTEPIEMIPREDQRELTIIGRVVVPDGQIEA